MWNTCHKYISINITMSRTCTALTQPHRAYKSLWKNSKFYIACTPWYISGLINWICLLLNTQSDIFQFEIPQPAKYGYILIDKHLMNTYTQIYALICTKLYAWIYMRKRVTLSYMGISLQHSAQSFLYKTLRLISMARNRKSAVFNHIAWHQIYNFIIKVQRVKIGNILSEVIKQWRS